MRTLHRVPLDFALFLAQQEFEFAGTASPPRRLIGRANDGGAGRLLVGYRGVTQCVWSTDEHVTVVPNRKWQSPNCAPRIAKQAQAISRSHLISRRVVTGSHKRTEVSLDFR